jgi:hypothetical protein
LDQGIGDTMVSSRQQVTVAQRRRRKGEKATSGRLKTHVGRGHRHRHLSIANTNVQWIGLYAPDVMILHRRPRLGMSRR